MGDDAGGDGGRPPKRVGGFAGVDQPLACQKRWQGSPMEALPLSITVSFLTKITITPLLSLVNASLARLRKRILRLTKLFAVKPAELMTGGFEIGLAKLYELA